MRDGVAQPLIAWIFAGADHLVRNARFLLSLPAPPVEALLATPERTMASTAQLLLVLAPAVATRFIPQVGSMLEEIAGTAPSIETQAPSG